MSGDSVVGAKALRDAAAALQKRRNSAGEGNFSWNDATARTYDTASPEVTRRAVGVVEREAEAEDEAGGAGSSRSSTRSTA